MATYFFARQLNIAYNEREKGFIMPVIIMVLIISVIALAYVAIRVYRQKYVLEAEVRDLKTQLYLNQHAIQLVTYASWVYYIESKPRYYPHTCHIFTGNRMVSHLTGNWPSIIEFQI